MTLRNAAALNPAAERGEGLDAEQLGGQLAHPIASLPPHKQSLPGQPPHRPPAETIDGRIAATWRKHVRGEITWAEAERRDTALRLKRGRAT